MDTYAPRICHQGATLSARLYSPAQGRTDRPLHGTAVSLTDGSHRTQRAAPLPAYNLKRWVALTRYLNDGQLRIDSNRIEQAIRPIAVGRNNWLFAGSLRAGKRTAAVMSLVQSARINGHDPYAYLRDVLTRLPTHPNNRIGELLPHRW